jgi:hypothetical protein
VDHDEDPLTPESGPSGVPGDPYLQPVATILFGASTPHDSELKAYPPMPMDDATQLLRSIAYDEQLTAAERSASMLAPVRIPGTVLFNANDTKAWQVLLGGYACQTLPPPHHRRRPHVTPRPAGPTIPSPVHQPAQAELGGQGCMPCTTGPRSTVSTTSKP